MLKLYSRYLKLESDIIPSILVDDEEHNFSLSSGTLNFLLGGIETEYGRC